MDYFTTEGRTNRWKYFLQIITPSLLGGIGVQAMSIENLEVFAIGFFTAILAHIVSLFPAIRRLHNINASGWWFTLSLVPLANFALWLALLFVKGTEGANRFGSDPLQSHKAQDKRETPNQDTKRHISSARAEGKAQTPSAQEFDPDEHEKKCPMCAEYIKIEARRCKHCGHESSDEEVEQQIEERKQKVKERREVAEERGSEPQTAIQELLDTHDFTKGSTQCKRCGVTKAYAKNTKYECPQL